MVASIIEKEEDLAHRQTFGVSGIAQQMLLSEASLLEVAFSQHSIDFIDGVAPHRVESILDSLRASLALFDDSVWIENAAVLMSLPAHCSACDNFGHLTRDCMHFKGLAREEKGFLPAAQHVSGKYVLEKLGLTVDFRRVVGVNDQLWEVGSASGRQFNCLIDTVRQSLNLPSSDALLDAVRDDLAQEFPLATGEFRVRRTKDMLGPNFLEFTEHTRAVARLLFKHAGIDGKDVVELKFICCDLDTERTTVVDASRGGGREVVILRKNQDHFMPLIASHVKKEELLPWKTDTSAILARRHTHTQRRSFEERLRADEKKRLQLSLQLPP